MTRSVASETSSRSHGRRSDRSATAWGFSPIAGEFFAMDDEGGVSLSPSCSPRRGDDRADVGGGERVSRTAGRKRQRAREHEGAAAVAVAVPSPSCATRCNPRSSPSRRCDERKRQRASLPRAPHAPHAPPEIPLTPELTRVRSSPTPSLSPRSRSRRNRATATATAAARDRDRDRGRDRDRDRGRGRQQEAAARNCPNGGSKYGK